MENKEEKVVPVMPVESSNNSNNSNNNNDLNVQVLPINEDVKVEVVEQEKLSTQVSAVEPTTVDSVSSTQNVNTNYVQPVQPVQPDTPVQNVAPVLDSGNVNNSNDVIGNTTAESGNKDSNGDNNSGPSTFGKVMTVLLFVFLFAFIYFLGDITEFINQKKLEKSIAGITSGRLVCNTTKDTEALDIKINAAFSFDNSKINSLVHTTTSTGDKFADKQELEGLLNDCKRLKEEVKSYDGVSIICSLNNGINSVKQTFNYSKLDMSDVRAAFAEAGGVYPQFKNGDSISSVESKMISSGYECEKIGN